MMMILSLKDINCDNEDDDHLCREDQDKIGETLNKACARVIRKAFVMAT